MTEVIEVAVFEIELAAEVGQRIPSAQIVVDAHARIPLRDVVDLALLRHAPRSATAPYAGDLVVVLDVNLQLAAVALQRLLQSYLHARVADNVVGFGGLLAGFDLDGVEDIALGRGVCRSGVGVVSAPAGHSARDDACPGIFAINVLLELQPQAGQRIRTVVGVSDGLRSAKLLRRRVEVGVQFVTCLVLPVVRAGRPVAGTVGVDRIGQGQRCEGEARVVRGRSGLRRSRRAEKEAYRREQQPKAETAERERKGGHGKTFLPFGNDASWVDCFVHHRLHASWAILRASTPNDDEAMQQVFRFA